MWELIVASLGLGLGLTMDACAVSMSNGLNEPQMKFGKATLIAAMFGFFQAAMPMLGWLCVSLVAEQFAQVAKYIPYVALALLVIIGGKMLYDGIKDRKKPRDEQEAKKLTFGVLLAQAVATSIDALSTGFSLAGEHMAGNLWWKALISVGIIGVITFGFSLGSVYIGKKFGTKLGYKAQILGGCILISIGVEIFVTGVFF